MAETESKREAVEQLAEEFMVRYRNGERPSIAEYVQRYPDQENEIREVLEAAVLIERLAPASAGNSLSPSERVTGEDGAELEQLGDFRIIREVGRGGMGIVYEAEQVSLGRRVALKVLPKQSLLDAKYKKRFLREAKAAASLHHTNIVPVFGVGEQDGLHYYVMQFIYGLGLDEVLVELQRLREASIADRAEGRGSRVEGRVREVSAVAVAESLISGRFEHTLLVDSDSEGTVDPSPSLDAQPLPLDHTTAVGRLSETHHGSGAFTLPGQSEHTSKAHSRSVYWQSVARIGLQAAEALQYAHDQGIVHRDVKPGNLLLDSRSGVWVTDFGLAKAADQQNLTHTGDIVGTLRYMAPEQFDGKADARSDVFSLGLTLYELLTLKPAFNERDRHKLIRQVTTGAPPRLRALDPHISRDLETIVHKAIDRDPSHRYQTAGELSADLQRYLGNEPIRARWISPATRFTRWCRRNPAIAALTTTIAVLLCVAAVGSSIAAVRLKKLADEKAALAHQAKMDEAEAEQARGEAEAAATREKELRTLAESERDRANTNFSLARSAVNTYLDEVNESELLSVPGLQPLREKLLSSAMVFYTKFTQERTDDPTLLMELADAQYRLGRIHGELGDKTGAAEANLEAIRLFEHLREQQPENLDLQGGLAHAYVWASRYDETVNRYDESIKLCESILETEPHHPEIRSLLADTYNTLAIDDKNDIATALAYHQKALELREALAREFPDDPVHLAELGGTVNNIGVLLAEQDKNAEALQMFERAVGYSARAYELQPHSIRWGEWLCLGVRNCAYKQDVAGATEEARQSFARLVALRRDLAWNNPAVNRLQADLYRACLEQSRYEQQLGNEAEAERAIREGRRILELIPHDDALQLVELSLMYASLSRPVEGATDENAFDADERANFAEQAVASLRDAIQAGYRNLAALKQDKLLDPLRDRDDFRELLSALEKLREGEGLTANDKGTVEEQIANRREALRILRELQDQLDVRTTLAATLHSIGVVQTGLKQFDEAEESLQQTLSIRRELLEESPNDPQTRLDLLSSQVALGEVDWARGDFTAAHTQWQHCLTESAAIAAAYPDSSIVREGRMAEAENVIYGRYGRLGLWPLLLEFADRTARYERPASYGTTGYGDGQLAAGVLAANDRDATERLLRRFAASLPDAHGASGMTKLAYCNLIDCAAVANVDILPPDEMVSIAEEAFDEFSDKWFVGVALAAAQYRAGEYAAALETVRPFRNQHLPFLEAAITQRLGDYEGAATLWDDAESRYQSLCADILQHPPSQDDFLHLSDWSHDWWHFATIQAVRREAYSVIFGGAYDDPWQHLLQARGYRLIGEIRQSESELAAAAVGDDPDLWLARARLFDRWGDVERAEGDWRHIVELAGADPMPLIQRGRWYAGRGEHKKADADFVRAALLTPNELNRFLEAGWWVVGPYPTNLNEFCQPEIDPDPSQPVYVIDPQTGLSDEPVAWQHAPTGRLGEVRMGDVLGRSDGSGYALAYVYSPEECTRLLRVGVAKGMRIWCNRQLVFSADEPLSGNQISASRVPVSLQSGRNEILVRVRLNAPLTLRVADTPADRVLTFGEQGLWKEAADAAFASEASAFGVPIHDEGYFALIRAALLSGDEEVLQREGERLLQMALGDPSLWNQVRAAGTLIFVDNPLVREHAAELEAALTAVLPATSSNHSQYQDCLRSLVRYAAMLGHIDAARHYVTQLGGDGDKVRAHLAPLWAIVMEREGLHDEALATLELGLHAAAEYQDTYWPWLVWFLGGLRDAEREITGGTARTDEIMVSLGRSALADWESRDPDSAAFDHLAETWGRSGTSVAGPAYPYLARGRRLAELGRFDDAEADFNKAVELASDDPDVFIARAIFRAERSAPETAADDLDSALRLAAAMDEGTAWTTRRKVALQAAIRPVVFERLVSHNEHGAENELWHVRMVLLAYDGDLDAAREAALQLERFGFQPQRAAVALLHNDRLEFERIRDSRAADWNPVYTPRLLMLAPADQATTGELLSTARQVLDANPDDWHARVNWGIALYRDGRQPEAREQLEPLANSHLRGVVWPVLAMIHHQLGDEPQARQWLQRSNDWLSWQHAGTSADAPRIFKPGVNGIEDWLVASVFNLEGRGLIDGQIMVPHDELPATTETAPELPNGEPPPRDTPEAHDP